MTSLLIFSVLPISAFPFLNKIMKESQTDRLLKTNFNKVVQNTGFLISYLTFITISLTPIILRFPINSNLISIPILATIIASIPSIVAYYYIQNRQKELNDVHETNQKNIPQKNFTLLGLVEHWQKRISE